MNGKRIHKKILIIMIPAAVIILLLTALYLIRIRGSEVLRAERDVAAAHTVFYRQTDAQWADDTLGQSSYTMAKSGCLVVCLAALLEMEGVSPGTNAATDPAIDPGGLNQWLTEHQVYDEQGNLRWEPLQEAGGLAVAQVNNMSEQKPAQILADIESGRYPIARVRMNGIGSFHYVLLVGAQNGVLYCMDPLNEQEETVPLSKFGNRVYALRYVY